MSRPLIFRRHGRRMLSLRVLRLSLLFALALFLGGFPISLGSSGLFMWNGGDADDNNLTSVDNWGGSGRPGQNETTNHTVVIDDDYPRPIVVQDDSSLTLASLYIGDGHTLDLNNDITVETAGDSGFLQFRGSVVIYRLNTESPHKLDAQWIYVYDETDATFIRTTEKATVTTK